VVHTLCSSVFNSQEQDRWGHQGSPSHRESGIRHLPGDEYSLRAGWDVGPRVSQSLQDQWLGRAELQGAADQPCWGIIDGAGADSQGG